MKTSGIRLFPFIAFPTLVGLLGLSLLIMGWGDLFTLAKWIDCDHEYLLPYIFAVLLSISYPTGILINYSLQYLNKARLKIKSLLKSKESDNKSQESDNSTKEYIEIMCSDRTGLVIKELEIRYGFLVFWRLCVVAAIVVIGGFIRILGDNLFVGRIGILVSIFVLIVSFLTHIKVSKQNDDFRTKIIEFYKASQWRKVWRR